MHLLQAPFTPLQPHLLSTLSPHPRLPDLPPPLPFLSNPPPVLPHKAPPLLAPRAQLKPKRPGPTNQQTRIIMFRNIHLPPQLIRLFRNMESPSHSADTNEQLRFNKIDTLADAPAVAEGGEAFYGWVAREGGEEAGGSWGEPA